MMSAKTIWKYSVEPQTGRRVAVVDVPVGARIVYFGYQHPDGLCIWTEFEVPDDVGGLDGIAREERRFRLYGTGQAIPPDAVYVGTVQSGPLVWHLHETTHCQDGVREDAA